MDIYKLIKAGLVKQACISFSFQLLPNMHSKRALTVAILLAATALLSLVAAHHVPIENAGVDGSQLLQDLNASSEAKARATSTIVQGEKEHLDIGEEKLIIGLPNNMYFPRRLPPSCKARKC